MIFLTVGNWHKGFDRLVKAVDELVESGVITEQVTAQTGYSSYRPSRLTTVAFCSPDDFVRNIKIARVIITHAGMGTIIQAVKLEKPAIVVPRKASLGEHLDDHQLATARQLESESKVLVAYEVSELPEKLQEAKSFVPAEGQGGQEIIRAIEIFLDKLQAKKRMGAHGIDDA